MNTKTIVLSLLFCLISTLGFTQSVKGVKKSPDLREVNALDIKNVQQLIGSKGEETLVSYKLSLINREANEVFIWEKDSFDEAGLAMMIEEKKSKDCVLIIENIVVTDPYSGKDRGYNAIKVRIK